MTIEELKDRGLIIMECISGSRAYGLHTPESDTDIKGVFILPKTDFYSMNYIPQVSNETNDIVYYELGRFMELLSVNNPNIIELLNTPKHAVIYKHSIFEKVTSELILSKLCEKSFGKFAFAQIKKAKGLNKKILNPVDKKRKSVLEFCYVNYENGSIPLRKYLEIKSWAQENCGLSKIPNMKDIYGLYYNLEADYKGVVRSEEANAISLSSILIGEQQECLLYFNADGYSSYCKDYKAYWSWVEKRNETRYENTLSHGKNYDAKNMMHTFRLLEMALEIAKEEIIHVKRNDRNFLLKVKAGEFEYDDLLTLAKKKQAEMEIVFENSNLQERPNVERIDALTYQMREELYQTYFN